MSDDLLRTIERNLRDARVALRGDDRDVAAEGQRLLREANQYLADVPRSSPTDLNLLRALQDVRNELGGYLLAAEELEQAGVSPQVVVEILRRGAAEADGRLGRLAGAVLQD
jgi:hypothetical protein